MYTKLGFIVVIMIIIILDYGFVVVCFSGSTRKDSREVRSRVLL